MMEDNKEDKHQTWVKTPLHSEGSPIALNYTFTVEPYIPFVETGNAFGKSHTRCIARCVVKTSRVGKSGIDIAGLHLLHLHDRGATCNTLYLVDEVHETNGRGMTDVIDAVRNGAGRKVIQKRHDAGNDVINVGEVATQIAMIENANGKADIPPGTRVLAPLNGTFYRSDAPGKPKLASGSNTAGFLASRRGTMRFSTI